MRAYVRRFFVVLVLVGLGLSAAQAEDAPAFEARLYRVGALTAGNVDFLPHGFPLVSPDMVSDEESPLFGTEAEEPRWPFGLAAELMELVRSGVSPSFWEDVEGAGMASFHGDGMLLVRATPAVHEELGRFLAALERRALRTLTIDLQAVRMPSATGRGKLVLDDAALAALLAGGEVGPSVRFTALPGQRALAYDGAEIAYLQDGDMEVTQPTDLMDPIVGVLSVGLSAAVRAMPTEDGRSVTLGVRARLSEPTPMRTQSDERGWRYDLAGVAVTGVQSIVTVPTGAWALLDGSGGGETGGWCFLVRATIASPNVTKGSRGIRLLRAPAFEAGATMETRLLDVDDLLILRPNLWGRSLDVVPSNFMPPEPPEYPEPVGALSPDALVHLLRKEVAPGAWEGNATKIEVGQWRYLLVRNTPAIVDVVAKQVQALRRELLGSLVTTLEVVEMGADVAARLEIRSGILRTEARTELDEAIRSGAVRRIDGARVVSDSGLRNTVESGTWLTYLQDYEVELKSAPIPNPVMQTLFSGIVLDVAATLGSDQESAHVMLRIDRTHVEEPIRVLQTPHGGLDLPTLQLLRVRSGLSVPVGRTAVVGGARSGERHLLLLLTVDRLP